MVRWETVYICWFVDYVISMDKLILGKVVDLDKGIKQKIIERCQIKERGAIRRILSTN